MSPSEDAPTAADDVRPLVEALVAVAGPPLAAIVFFGSRLLGSSPNVHSAADFFVVVDDYGRFYREFNARAGVRRHAGVLAALNRVLAPNILAFAPSSGPEAGAKCFIMSRSDLRRALSNRAPDHFCRGRLSQQVEIVHARDGAARREIEAWLQGARDHSLAWVPLYCRPTFTVDDYCLRMLEVSYRSEIRPESSGRVQEVFAVQRAAMLDLYGAVLDMGVERGRLIREHDRFRLADRPRLMQRLRWRWFFGWSKVRATLRWAKYMATYDNWLDYIIRKVHRRTGIQLELTANERRFPLIFGWPKAVRVLRALRTAPDRSSTGSPPEERP
jgi:hypothetical protein